MADKQNNSKNGYHLTFTFLVTDGEYEGREVNHLCNYANPNAVSQRIGLADIKKVWEATGNEGELEDTDDMLEVDFYAKFGHTKPSADWPSKNDLKKALSVEDYNLMLEESED